MNNIQVIRRGKTIDLNGVQERVLSVPTHRDGEVKISFGGREDFPTSVLLKTLEANASAYIPHLASPCSETEGREAVGQLKSSLSERGFKVSEEKEGRASGYIEFINDKNRKVQLRIDLSPPSSKEGQFTLRYEKYSVTGVQSKSTRLNSPSARLLVDYSLQVIDQELSRLVQNIITPPAEPEPEHGQRMYSESGTPKLHPGESLESYFSARKAPAGIVINGRGRYQAFYSYQAVAPNVPNRRKEVLHYDTKDYKTRAGAERFLNKRGYDAQGRHLPIESVEGIEEAVRNYINNGSRRISWTPSENFLVVEAPGCHSIVCGRIEETKDPDLGATYSFSLEILDSQGEKVRQEKVRIDSRDNGNPQDAVSAIFEQMNRLEAELKESADKALRNQFMPDYTKDGDPEP